MNSHLDVMQHRVGAWVKLALGQEVLQDRKERARRVLEEACELAQAEGLEFKDCISILQHVTSRPPGDPEQEAAGVGVTLLAWGASRKVSVYHLIHQEMMRVSVPATAPYKRHAFSCT